MPIYDFQCNKCEYKTEHIVSYDKRKSVTFDCKECDGDMSHTFTGSKAPYQPSIERLVELERGHLSGYRPPPQTYTGPGGGIRKFAGYVGGES